MKKVPFFAKYLEGQKPEGEAQQGDEQKGAVKTGVVAGRPITTIKYPSDRDEAVTMKYPSDGDEINY